MLHVMQTPPSSKVRIRAANQRVSIIGALPTQQHTIRNGLPRKAISGSALRTRCPGQSTTVAVLLASQR
jgi:hypothetical protein